MKESLRKPLLFIIIVVVGSVLVLVDIPLLLLFPVLILVGFGTLLALGSVTLPEIRGGLADLGKSGILKRLNDMKFFEKSPATPSPAVAKPAPAPVPVKKEAGKKKESEEKPGLRAHISTLFSSLGSLGSILRQKGKQEKKVEDIDRLLDRTVSEKVSAPPPSATTPAMPARGGGASGSRDLDMDDPFMSLSGDEFDEGLLEGLGDDTGSAAPAPAPAAPAPESAPLPDPGEGGVDLPVPELDVSSAASDILRQAGEGTESSTDAFSGLDSGSLPDEDFGDLDGLSLDDVSLDTDLEAGTGAEPAAPPAPGTPVQPAPAAAPVSDSNAIKTAWIPSDAPKDAGEIEDEVSTQADMAAFASGSGGDEDLLSSLAADVKHVKKEQDLSLLRELKDFRAPANEIEKELSGVFERMSAGKSVRKKEPPATKGIK